MKKIAFAVVAAVLAAAASELTRRVMRRAEPLPAEPSIDLTAPRANVFDAASAPPAA